MEYIEKATRSQGRKTVDISIITAIASISAAGIVLSVYSLSRAEYLYWLLYLIAAIMGIAYVVIKINSIIPSYIAVTEDKLHMQCWENGVFPYVPNFKPAFFADFVPAKVKKMEIPIRTIKNIYVGSKNYLVRSLEATTFPKEINDAIRHRKADLEFVRKMDFICVLDKKDRVNFMTVTDIDKEELARIINFIHRKNEDVEIKCNLRDLRSMLTF